MRSTPCDGARVPVTPGGCRVATVIGVLTLLVVLSPLTAVCFGDDGHVAVEVLPMVHHLMSESGASGDQRAPSAVATSRNGHGPCVDVFLEPVYASDSQAGGGAPEWMSAAANQAAPVAMSGWPLIAVSIQGTIPSTVPLVASLHVRSLHTTLLRI
jgi:hypothetical protein